MKWRYALSVCIPNSNKTVCDLQATGLHVGLTGPSAVVHRADAAFLGASQVPVEKIVEKFRDVPVERVCSLHSAAVC